MSSVLNKIFKNKKDEEVKASVDVKVEKKDEVATKKSTTVVKDVKVVKASKSVSKNKKRVDSDAYKILLHPVITEKATDLTSLNKYIFAVPLTANKSEIKKKVENVYGVTPVKINIIKKEGKNVRYGRTRGRTKSWKKAIITLNSKDKLEIYEGV